MGQTIHPNEASELSSKDPETCVDSFLSWRWTYGARDPGWRRRSAAGLVLELASKARAILERGGSVSGAHADEIASTLGCGVVEGGQSGATSGGKRVGAAEVTKLERELREAETRERRAAEAVARERARLEDLDRRRSEARERLPAAEAELRGISLESRRLAERLARTKGKVGR